MSRRRTSSINILNFIGTTSLRTSRPLSITSMLPRLGVGGLQASTATYFVPSVSCVFRGHSGKSRYANGRAHHPREESACVHQFIAVHRRGVVGRGGGKPNAAMLNQVQEIYKSNFQSDDIALD